ncbi:competence type IV pilus minor pilin ComGE [Bacillus sp. NPDC077027]|uniref:competence type IV pilus minor pilin ComGE n=1 Tax=Bacillus sp. NPDC077027 TaxID=3390548 RepID=UPI003D06B163
MFKNKQGFSTIDTLFACQMLIFTASILVPCYEMVAMSRSEVNAKVAAYQFIHEQMNAAFSTGEQKSVSETRGRITYELDWQEQKVCVLYKLQKKETICFTRFE